MAVAKFAVMLHEQSLRAGIFIHTGETYAIMLLLQEVVSNLMISAIEFRGEEDADVAPYRHETAREVVLVQPSREVAYARSMLMQAFRHVMASLGQTKVRSSSAMKVPRCHGDHTHVQLPFRMPTAIQEALQQRVGTLGG